MKQSNAAAQKGNTGLKNGYMEESDKFPPIKVPKIKLAPAKTDKNPNLCDFVSFSSVKSAIEAKQIDKFPAKRPVMILPRKTKNKSFISMPSADIIYPAQVDPIVKIKLFFRPFLSAYSPINGAARN